MELSLPVVPENLRDIIATLGVEYPLNGGANAVRVVFEPGAPEGALEVNLRDGAALIRYDRPAQACRGLGALLADIVKPGDPYREQTSFSTVGIMLDCSRNAVMTVAHFQRWLRQLALLGYNLAMLYMEDTFALPGEDYFGYLRGRYSAEELKEIDEYAARLGIELVGCIEALGHLEQALKWPAYDNVKDTGSVLMVGEEKTYALIEKMIARIAETHRSRRIHIGLDETWDLGRGRYMNQFGYRRGYDLFNEHLQRVTAICERHGLQPMIWSDMFFRMGSPTQDYYDTTSVVPDDVKRQIPAAAQLVYWDYYHDDKAVYAQMLRKHRDLGFEPIMGSGVWTWSQLWYLHSKTAATVPPCIDACRELGVKEIFFTLWGDDGAYCEFDSALAGLTYVSELAYGSDHATERFATVCGTDYDAVLAVSAMHDPLNPVMLLWDDPLLRIAWTNELLKSPLKWQECAAQYRKILRQLRPHRDTTEPIDFAHAATLLRFLQSKIKLNETLDAAYPSRDPAGLTAARKLVKAALRALEALHTSFRRQWHRRNKPFGFDTIQVRLGGQRQRFLELDTRLAALLDGKLDSIPEFDERPTVAMPSTPQQWRHLATAGIL